MNKMRAVFAQLISLILNFLGKKQKIETKKRSPEMASFGARSRKKLEGLDPILRSILEEAIKVKDFTILETIRAKEVQDGYFDSGKSKLRWPESKHNLKEGRNDKYSLAVDIAPWNGGIDWDNKGDFYYLQGIVKGIASNYGVNIRFGGDWDGDGQITDQSFNDLPHVELVI